MICYVPNILLASNPFKLNNPALVIFFSSSFGYDCPGVIFVLSEYRQRHALRKGMGPLSPHLATYKEEP